MVREMLSGPPESDASLKLRLKLLHEVVDLVGPERFIEAVEQAIRISDRRSDVTVAKIRRLAGINDAVPSPAALAWEIVTTIVMYHLSRDGNGICTLTAAGRMENGKFVERPLPEIPEAVARTVRMMGGWTALASSYPEWWGQRFSQFKELFHETIGNPLGLTKSPR
jgi:hypothetical protein